MPAHAALPRKRRLISHLIVLQTLPASARRIMFKVNGHSANLRSHILLLLLLVRIPPLSGAGQTLANTTPASVARRCRLTRCAWRRLTTTTHHQTSSAQPVNVSGGDACPQILLRFVHLCVVRSAASLCCGPGRPYVFVNRRCDSGSASTETAPRATSSGRRRTIWTR